MSAIRGFKSEGGGLRHVDAAERESARPVSSSGAAPGSMAEALASALATKFRQAQDYDDSDDSNEEEEWSDD